LKWQSRILALTPYAMNYTALTTGWHW